MKKLLFICLIVAGLAACSDVEKPIGIWDDNIKLSTKNVEFTTNTDSVTITTQGDWWWVDGITFESNTYSYYDREEIDLESDSYTITENQFIVQRKNKNTLFVKIFENKSGAQRTMYISLEAGDYFDHVNITQAAK